MADGISIREFARREGCDEKVVRRKITSGHLPKLPDGKLDPALVGTNWRNEAVLRPSEAALNEEAKAIVAAAGFVMLSKAEAEQKKENYLALLRELEYHKEAELVVAIDDVTTAVAQELSRVRNKLLGIPTRVAPRAAILKTAEEIKALIEEVIVEVLGELTADGHNTNNAHTAIPAIKS